MEFEWESDRKERKRGLTVVSTIAFLLLACALVAACLLLVGKVVKKELQKQSPPQENAQLMQAPTLEPPRITPEALGEAALILTPDEPSATPTIDPATIEASPAPSPTPSPTPAPTLRPVVKAPPFSRENKDVLLVVTNEDGFAAWYVLLIVRDDACRMISVPCNTITENGSILSEATGIRGAMRRLSEVVPVTYANYVLFSIKGAPALTDVLGGVTLDGAVCNGEAAMRYLEGGGADEMLRIQRQQEYLKALLVQARTFSFFKLLSLKYAVQGHVTSNLTLAQTTDIYALMRRIDPNAVRFDTLPVDSETHDGKRFYRADAQAVNGIMDALYAPES